MNATFIKGELSQLLAARYGEEFAAAGTERGVTERVNRYAAILRGILRDADIYTHPGGYYAVFNGAAYELWTERQLTGALQNWLEDEGVGFTEASRVATSQRLTTLQEKRFTPDRNKLCFSNCVYDLETGRTEGFSPSVMSIRSVPYEYRESAKCPLWERFLARVLPDAEERACLQELMGLPFVDRKRLSVEKMALFVGNGANGKSVVMSVWKALLGEGNVSTLTPRDLANNKMTYVLSGKMLNFSPDVEVSGNTFSSELKAIASGQTVTGWVLFEGAIEVEAPPLVFAMNRNPVIKDDSDGMWRRLLIFPFDVTIPASEQDRTLADKIISTELPGVIRWCLEGRRRLVWNRGNFSRCTVMDNALRKMRGEVLESEYPVKAYLQRRGLSVTPAFEGQAPRRIWAKDLQAGLSTLSKSAIARELSLWGIKSKKSGETYYEVFDINP